jgi:two-component system response regulator YesN
LTIDTVSVARRTQIQLHAFRALAVMSRSFRTERLSLADVAREVNLSPSYLSHVLKGTTRFGFKGHLRGIRMVHALHLLSTTPLTVKEIAEKTGHSGTAALDHEFHRWFQMTPGDFRSRANCARWHG